MTSSVEDIDVDQIGNIPDLSSILENEIETSDRCRMGKDSSNDEDMFADSSQEGSQVALDMFTFDSDQLSVPLPLEECSEATLASVLAEPEPAAVETVPQPAAVETQPHPAAVETEPQPAAVETQPQPPLETATSSTIISTPYPTGVNDCIKKMDTEEEKFYENYLIANSGDISSLRCTVCSHQLFVVNPTNIKFHPVLGVLICKGCRDYYNNGEFPKDETGYDEYCRWCADGGSLICCDTCTNVFCKSCLRRCLGRAALSDIKNGGGSWSCLVCNQQPLWSFRAQSRLIVTALENKRNQGGRKSTPSMKAIGSLDATVWLPACIAEAEGLAARCKSLASKASQILSKSMSDGKADADQPKDDTSTSSCSASHEIDPTKVAECCRQLRKAVTSANTAMKVLDKKIIRNYVRSYGNVKEIEIDCVESDASLATNTGDADQSNKRLVLKIKNFRGASKKEDYYAEIRGSPKALASRAKGAASKRASKLLAITDTALSTCDESETTGQVPLKTEPEEDDEDDDDNGEEFFDPCSDAINWEEDQSDASTATDQLLQKAVASVKIENQFDETIKDDCQNDDWNPFDAPDMEAIDRLVTGEAGPESGSIPEASASSLTESVIGNSVVSNGSGSQPTKGAVKDRKSPKKSRNSKSPRSSSDNTPSKNDEARRALLQDSSSELDSDGSLADLGLMDSPRVKEKKSKKRGDSSTNLETDLKLNSECAVVVKRIVESNSKEENGHEATGKAEEKDKKKKSKKRSDANRKSANRSLSDDEDEDDDEKDVVKPDKSKNKTPRAKREKGQKKERKAFSLSDLGSTSDTDESYVGEESSSKKAAAAVDQAAASDPVSTDHTEVLRQELLASSPSEDSDSDADQKEETIKPKDKTKTVETAKASVKQDGESDDSMGAGDDNGFPNDDDSDDDADGEKTGVRKSAKLLRNPKLLDSDDSDGANEASEGKSKNTVSNDVKEEEEESDPKKKKTKESKKKRRIHSDSDFESSDSDSDSGKKKRKRKGRSKAAKEEEDGEDDDDGDEDAESKPKRRRRIKKQASSSDDGSDSDVQILNESEAGGKSGRKNIKRIIKDKNLQDETRAAAKEEEDRRKRIAERQKHYNDVFIGNDALINAQIDHLVLDFDPTTKKELVTVHTSLVKKLKPHQVKGVKFMWDASFESIERIKEHPGSGCILAHCMGLGKSLQVVTLAHTVLTHPDCKVNRVLVVCPLSTVLNWVNEFKIWLSQDGMEELDVYDMASLKANDLRMYTLKNWYEGGGVMILGYDMYRNLTNEKKKGVKPKMRETFQRALVDPGPDLVVCDEGHLLKNEATATSKAMNRVRTRRRIVLTGTPLQNSLIEYHCMVQFVKPNLLGNKREFTNRFANPIKNGQCADSTDYDVRIMKRRAHVLHKMLEGSVQRFDYSVLTPFLPPKHEYVISIKMSEMQIKMYQYYLDRCAKGGPNANMSMGRGKGSGLFADFQELGRVWTHPKALHLSQLRRDLKAITEGHEDSEGSIADFIDDGSGSESDDGGVVCLDDSGDNGSDDDKKPKVNGWRSRTRAGRGNQPPPEEELGVTAPLSSTWWSHFVDDDDMVKLEHSGKLVLLMDILRQCELIGDKVLVFSQSLVSLQLIEDFLVAEDERMAENRTGAGNMDHPIGSWALNADYFRLDGSTSAELRKTWTNHFNNPSNLRARLFLISTRAGGLGINLVAANRVIIFDASWNPSHDVQSIFRVYRFGQKKPCYVYRFLAQGTMEEKIYDRQVTKLSLSCRVVDEQQIERHFNSADLNELYLFESDSHTRRPTPPLPKDRLLAELMIKRKNWIVTFHEHDSLLENKEEEGLNEDERKAAWEDFENEKRGLVHNAAPNIYTGLPGEMAGLGGMAGMMGAPGMPDIMMGLAGRTVAGIPLSNIAAMILNSNPGITQDEFLGRLRLTVDQLQNFSVQQTAATSNPMPQNISPQQPGDVQRLMMQRKVAADQLKRQFGPQGAPGGNPGPSGAGIVPRSRGRPPIGPHQRTDLYGLAPVIYSASASGAGPSVAPQGGSSNSVKPGYKPPPRS